VDLRNNDALKEGMIQANMRLQNFLQEQHAIQQHVEDSQIALPSLLSGSPTFHAIKSAVDEFVRLAPDDCDVLVLMDEILLTEIRFIEPHTFLCEGFDQNGHDTRVILHFSRVLLRVIHRPKLSDDRKVSRVIKGFADHKTHS